MPAASILPVALYNNKLYFLFGKENPMEDSAVGFSDFGGGIEKGESAMDAAVREGSEELTGFLGTPLELKKRLRKRGVYKIVHTFEKPRQNTYTVHLFPMSYDLEFVEYFNSNHSFLWNRMDKKRLNDSKLFEKIKVDWFCEDDLAKRRSEYRPFYRDIVDDLQRHCSRIRTFMKSKGTSKRTLRGKTQRVEIFRTSKCGDRQAIEVQRQAKRRETRRKIKTQRGGQ